MSTSIHAAVQVRMGSSRLPGKVLMPVAGQPLLGHLLDRLAQCRQLTGVVVATSVRPENDAIEEFCRQRDVACFRGDEDDVLGRMVGAFDMVGASIGVEVFGDCPLIDPKLVDEFVAQYLRDGALDWLGNDLETTYPPGMEVEVFAADALRDAARRCTDPSIREHGTLFIRQNPELYRIRNIRAPQQHHRPDLEIEVDAPEDLAVVEAVLAHFSPRRDFRLEEIIAFMDERPDIAGANSLVPRRWKAYRSED